MAHRSERRQGGEGIPGQQVLPGSIALVHDGTTLVAVAGPGVAVCLWNESSKVACLAHFAEAATYETARATARFGNVALPTAIRMVRDVEPSGEIEAQIFGGASQVGQNLSRGDENVAMARRVLTAKGVKIVSEDVGGTKGRKIVFQASTGHVAVVKVHHLRADDWNP